MTELQRSVTSFRRQGSSGLVWDDKFIAGIENQEAKANHNQQESGVGSTATLQRSRSAAARTNYRTVNVSPPSIDPPSPKLQTCGFCALFRKPVPVPKKRR